MDNKDINIHNRIISINGKSYRLQAVIDKTATDIHHILGRRYRMKYNTNIDQNKVRINRRKHVALNAFFWDKQSPREQLLEVFNLVKPVLSTWVRQELDTIINKTDDSLFYIPELLKCNKTKKKSEQSLKKSPESLFR